MAIKFVTSRQTPEQGREPGASELPEVPDNWLTLGLAVREALETGSWRKSSATSTEWLIRKAEATGLSAQSLRRFANMARFADRLAENGVVERAAEAGFMSLAKLELVSKIWELSPVKGAALARTLATGDQAAGITSLRQLREAYTETVAKADKGLQARKTGRRSAQASVTSALRDMSRSSDLVGPGRVIAAASSRSFPYVTVDGLIGPQGSKGFKAEEGVLVVRPREIASRTALLPLLAQCSWAATFFDKLWVIGRARDFPVGIISKSEDLDLNEIGLFVSHLGKCGANPNVGVVELTDDDPKVLREPKPGPSPDRREIVQRILTHRFYTRVSAGVGRPAHQGGTST